MAQDEKMWRVDHGNMCRETEMAETEGGGENRSFSVHLCAGMSYLTLLST